VQILFEGNKISVGGQGERRVCGRESGNGNIRPVGSRQEAKSEKCKMEKAVELYLYEPRIPFLWPFIQDRGSRIGFFIPSESPVSSLCFCIVFALTRIQDRGSRIGSIFSSRIELRLSSCISPCDSRIEKTDKNLKILETLLTKYLLSVRLVLMELFQVCDQNSAKLVK
jgi:hypothetical protein